MPSSLPKYSYVYILANKKNGTLYIGVTSDIKVRVWQHKNHTFSGFTKKYGIHLLVWYEQFEDINNAIKKEKQLKKWNRKWKIELIESRNPEWKDLFEELF